MSVMPIIITLIIVVVIMMIVMVAALAAAAHAMHARSRSAARALTTSRGWLPRQKRSGGHGTLV